MKLLNPIGQFVEVDGKNMNVYIEGSGNKTIVFLSGGGTASPVLDFKSLYSLLSDSYKIVVVEKFGYGFSDDYSDRNRDIDTILDDTRTALSKTGLKTPYILCPHSMSGLEAIYWSQKYPEEVEAIIGLDMAVPQYYSDMRISTAVLKLNKMLCKMGIVRLFSNNYTKTLYSNSSLTKEEKDIIKTLYSKRCISDAFINEADYCKKNAEIVNNGTTPKIPVLMFISNAEGINLDKSIWIDTAKNYASKLNNAQCVKLDCPHYIHDYRYEEINKKIKEFISTKL